MLIMWNVIWRVVVRLQCCFRKGVYHDLSWFSWKRLFALQRSYNSWQRSKIATQQIWLHNSLRSVATTSKRTPNNFCYHIGSRKVFLKYYIPGSLKLFLNFHGKTPPVLLKTGDLCSEMSSDFNYNFCYVRLPVEQNRENTYFIF